LSPFAPESVSFKAGKLMLAQMDEHIRARKDFAFETTLSGKTYINLLKQMKTVGYDLHMFFLWIPNVEMALSRVAQRVRNGGHDIPENVVRGRFTRGILNFFRDYRPLLDSWIMFNNYGPKPEIIATEISGNMVVIDHEIFRRLTKDQINEK
jgi:predicted ABC-type ATPase